MDLSGHHCRRPSKFGRRGKTQLGLFTQRGEMVSDSASQDYCGQLQRELRALIPIILNLGGRIAGYLREEKGELKDVEPNKYVLE